MGWGGVCKVIFMSNPTVVLRLGWGFDNSVALVFLSVEQSWQTAPKLRRADFSTKIVKSIKHEFLWELSAYEKAVRLDLHYPDKDCA